METINHLTVISHGVFFLLGYFIAGIVIFWNSKNEDNKTEAKKNFDIIMENMLEIAVFDESWKPISSTDGILKEKGFSERVIACFINGHEPFYAFYDFGKKTWHCDETKKEISGIYWMYTPKRLFNGPEMYIQK